LQYEPHIQEENAAYVHHVLVYACEYDIPEQYHNPEGHVCYTQNMPLDGCGIILFAWATGGEVSDIMTVLKLQLLCYCFVNGYLIQLTSLKV